MFLFYNNNNILSKGVKNKCKNKFKNVNNNCIIFNNDQKILLNPKFLQSGNILNYNKVKLDKILYRISCEIINSLDGDITI